MRLVHRRSTSEAQGPPHIVENPVVDPPHVVALALTKVSLAAQNHTQQITRQEGVESVA
jgi:hypothetical protein